MRKKISHDTSPASQSNNFKILNFFRYNSIGTSIILYFMVLIFIMVSVLSIISYQNTIQETEQISIDYTAQLLNQVNTQIDSYIENMKSIGIVVVNNRDVNQLMSFLNKNKGAPLSEFDTLTLEQLTAAASSHMDVVGNTRSEITNIALISRYGDVILSDQSKQVNPYSDYNLSDWYLQALSYKNEIVVSPSHVQRLIAGEYQWVISISKAILDPSTLEVTGVMVIDLNYRVIEGICEAVNLGNNGYIYLVDSRYNLIYHPKQRLAFSGVVQENTKTIFPPDSSLQQVPLEQEGTIYLRNSSGVTGWMAIGVVNTQDLISNRNYLIEFYLILAGIAVIFSALFAVLISSNITRPLKKLETSMLSMEQGNLLVQAEIEQNNEIGQLSNTFNHMVLRIRQLMESEVAKEEEKRKSELRALQAQINPHFLYNTLETIIWMSAGGKTEEVVQVTSALAQLFRTSLSQGESDITLAVEAENIESYLTIQKMRYKDKLSFQLDFPEELKKYPIPKLILQPVVENAIYHGLKPSPQGGKIEITARQNQDKLIITIKDNGVGMSTQTLQSLLSENSESKMDSHGIGIKNVNERIQLIYGSEYGLHFESTLGIGTTVTIVLPGEPENEGEIK